MGAPKIVQKQLELSLKLSLELSLKTQLKTRLQTRVIPFSKYFWSSKGKNEKKSQNGPKHLLNTNKPKRLTSHDKSS